MWHVADRIRLGCSFEGKDKDIASGRSACIDEAARQPAAASHDPKATRHSSLLAGR
jgi:hypothetical protein